jgi:ribosome-binding factor A
MSERMRRVNESVKQVVADALPELKDPRIGIVTVTGVRTSPDLRHATVYVSVLGNEKKRDKTMRGLAAAHGAVQTHLARELCLKRTPTLEFVFDPTVARGMEMSKLIDELVTAEPAPEQPE